LQVDLSELATMRSEYCKMPQRNHKRKVQPQRNGRKVQRNTKPQQRTK
jgi:hypothetical protein